MTITCPKCKARLKLADNKAKPEGTRIRCPKCGAVLFYKGKARKEEAEKLSSVPQVPPAQGEESAAEDLAAREEQPPGPPPASEKQPAPQIVAAPKKEEAAKQARAAVAPRELQKVSFPVEEEENKGLPGKVVMIGSAAGVLIVLVVAIFIFRSPNSPSTKQPPPQIREESPPQPPAQTPAPEQASPAEVSPAAPPPALPAGADSFATPEEKALGIVKRSDVLLKMTPVEAIVNKWTQDNAGKIRIVGWQVKKIDDRQYLVSYTGMEGTTPKGFYFVADIQSRTVEDLAERPDLQKQYNIQYSR